MDFVGAYFLCIHSGHTIHVLRSHNLKDQKEATTALTVVVLVPSSEAVLVGAHRKVVLQDRAVGVPVLESS